jgi:hypothetical protein
VFKKILGLMLLAITVNPSYAGFRDPTQPAYPVTSSSPTVANVEGEARLSAIWISQRSRWATINGIQAKQGQTIPGNIKILKIRKNAVAINQNGTIKILQLIKRPYKIR